MLEILAKLALTVIIVVTAGGALRWIWTHQIDVRATAEKLARGAVEPDWIATRDASKLYQGGRSVADVSGEVEKRDGHVVFQRLINVQGLNTEQPVEYGRLKLRVRQIESITGMMSTGMGMLQNVWDNVACDIVTN